MSLKALPTLSRRNLLRRGLAVLFTIAGPLIRSRVARAGSATQIWRCTYGDCEPYLYDPSQGAPNPMHPDHPIPPGVAFEDLPDDWICPICGSKKALFKKVAKTP